MTEAAPAAAAKPTTRNALLVFLLPVILIAIAPPLGAALGQTHFRAAPSFAMVTGFLIMFFLLQRMAAELRSVTGGTLQGWYYLIPVYGLYWAATTLRAEVAAAKTKAGKPEPRSAVMYAFLCVYAFASDLNDLA